MSRFLPKTGIILSLLTLIFAPINQVFATTEPELYRNSQVGNYYYDSTARAACTGSPIDSNNVTIIGDSISVGAESEYSNQLPGADFESQTFSGTTYNLVETSKHFATDAGTNYSGLTIAAALQQQGALRPYLVFALGTNDPGAVTTEVVDQLIELVGENHQIVLTTNYAVDDQNDYTVNNAAIRAAGTKYKNVAVADWAEAVKEDPNKYIGDGYVHPSGAGSQLFVKLIKQALNELSGSVGNVSTGGNRNYAGATVWSDTELQAIEANYEIYAAAAEEYNFPWQVLAVVHSLETGLTRYNPPNGEGVYQLTSYTNQGTNANRFEPADSITEDEFRRQTFLAAEIISTMVGDLNDPQNVKKLFFSYNGQAQVYIEKALALGFSEEEAKSGEGSPYVMNRYDEKRDPTSANMSENWPGRYVQNGVYDATSTTASFGAFVKYEALTGTANCSSTGASIASTALALSWPPTESHAKDDPKPAYVTAMKKVGSYTSGCESAGVCAPIGASCDQFVATVMRYSGADPDFPIFGPGTQESYMANSDKYQLVETHEDVSNLQPGDIFVTAGTNGNHIYLYIGELDGQPAQASASFNHRTGEHFPGVYFSDNDGARVYNVYRRIR